MQFPAVLRSYLYSFSRSCITFSVPPPAPHPHCVYAKMDELQDPYFQKVGSTYPQIPLCLLQYRSSSRWHDDSTPLDDNRDEPKVQDYGVWGGSAPVMTAPSSFQVQRGLPHVRCSSVMCKKTTQNDAPPRLHSTCFSVCQELNSLSASQPHIVMVQNFETSTWYNIECIVRV